MWVKRVMNKVVYIYTVMNRETLSNEEIARQAIPQGSVVNPSDKWWNKFCKVIFGKVVHKNTNKRLEGKLAPHITEGLLDTFYYYIKNQYECERDITAIKDMIQLYDLLRKITEYKDIVVEIIFFE